MAWQMVKQSYVSKIIEHAWAQAQADHVQLCKCLEEEARKLSIWRIRLVWVWGYGYELSCHF
jgi:hypothetical protein